MARGAGGGRAARAGPIDTHPTGAVTPRGGTAAEQLNRDSSGDDQTGMPIAPRVVASEGPHLGAVDAVTLLPSRAVLFDRIGERAVSTDRAPAALVLIGLLRRDDGWPMPGRQLDQVAAMFSRSVRGDDWLARSGPAEFAFLLNGLSPDAETAAHRLVDAVAGEGIPGLTAAAGIAGLGPEVSAGEVHRRATLCLTAARSVGSGQVIRYRGTRH